MRFRLSTLLLLMTLLATTIGLGHRIYVLEKRVATLTEELEKSHNSMRRFLRVTQRTNVGVPYSVDEAMLGDAMEGRMYYRQLQNYLHKSGAEINLPPRIPRQ